MNSPGTPPVSLFFYYDCNGLLQRMPPEGIILTAALLKANRTLNPSRKTITPLYTRAVIIALLLQLIGDPSFSQPSCIVPERQSGRLESMRMEISLCALAAILLSILMAVLYRSRIVKEQYNRALKAKNLEIEEQKKRIEQQAADLRHNNSQKDQLFSIIAHDLSGPLNSLKSVLDLIKKRSLSEVEVAKAISSLKNNVDNSADLVNNLVYWARSQMNGIEASPVLLQAEPLAAAALNLYAMQAAEKNICLENKLDDDFVVYADKDMIQLVFRNAISNAIKFCKPGDRITIEGGASVAGLAEICVIDTGTGIKEEILEKINNRKRVTTSGTSAELGTGLGLMLCQEFVEKNRGHFRLLSTLDKGTRICFALPVRPQHGRTTG